MAREGQRDLCWQRDMMMMIFKESLDDSKINMNYFISDLFRNV